LVAIGIAFVVVIVVVVAVVLLCLTCFTYACSVVCLFASSSSMKAPAGRKIAESTGL
jgi:type IV secretory pathway VirB6-like protein